MGSPTVFINGQMACRLSDIVVEVSGLAMGPADPILMGCPTVILGESVWAMMLNHCWLVDVAAPKCSFPD
jgi:hypothetical protein